MTIRSKLKRFPWTIAQADVVVRRMRARNVKIAKANAEANKHLRAYRRERATINQLLHANAQDEAKLSSFADDHRDVLTQNGKTKSFMFPSGGVAGWRYPSKPSLTVVGKLPTVIRLLLRLPNWPKYVKLELRKDNIKADFDELKKTPGLRHALRIEKKERFWLDL